MPAADGPLLPGKAVGVQTFLDKEVDAANIRRTADMLKEGGVTNVRQAFSWCELETTGRGVYWDNANNKPSWQKYDQIVDTLTADGIAITARLDNAPTWSRPGQTNDPASQCQKGPPTDLSAYTDFVRDVHDALSRQDRRRADLERAEPGRGMGRRHSMSSNTPICSSGRIRRRSRATRM